MQKPALPCPAPPPPRWGIWPPTLHPNPTLKPPPRLPGTGGLDNTVAAQRGWEYPRSVQVALLSLGSLQETSLPQCLSLSCHLQG